VPQRDSGEPYEGDLHRRARWRYPAFRSEMLYGCTCQKGPADNSTQTGWRALPSAALPRPQRWMGTKISTASIPHNEELKPHGPGLVFLLFPSRVHIDVERVGQYSFWCP
jgi:hypothetical protein